jgi:hypothetical protein
MVLPAAVALAELLWLKRAYRAIAVTGFVFGLIAVALYDLFRVPFIMAGIWGDFIPSIGTWLVPDGNPHPIIGYLYRYIGDGGGMGMGFVALYPLLRRMIGNPILCGIGYGIFIWGGLLATLFLAPRGQELLFHATPLILTLSGTGHVIYGAVLGALMKRASAPALTGMVRQEDLAVSTLTSS